MNARDEMLGEVKNARGGLTKGLKNIFETEVVICH